MSEKKEKENPEVVTTEKDLNETIDKEVTEKVDKIVGEVDGKISKGISDSFEKLIGLMEERIPKQTEKKEDDEKIMKSVSIQVKPTENRLGILGIAMAKSKYNGESLITELENMGIEKSQFGTIQDSGGRIIDKAMSVNTLADGGILVPEIWADEIIPALTNKTVVRKAGAGVIDMPNGNIKMPRWTSIPSGYWIGETTRKTEDSPELDSLSMNNNKLAVDVAVPNDVLRYAKYNTPKDIQMQVIKGISITEDEGFLAGQGSSHQPLGLDSQCGTSEVATGSATAVEMKSDLLKLPKSFATNNVEFDNPVWIMHTRELWALATQVDANSNPMDYARTLLTDNPTLFGYPVYTTNHISTTGGSTIYFIDMSMVKIGEAMKPTFKFVENGTYWDGSAYVNGRVTDQSVFTAMEAVDIVLRQSYAGAKLTAVTYGA